MSAASDDFDLQVRLASTLDSYQSFVQDVLDRLESLAWSTRDLFGVQMALEESISNAIRHGNRFASDKHVMVQCRGGAERFWAQVCDEGEGFNPGAVPDCRRPDRLEVPGGRGLTLIRAYMTHVAYNQRGNCLTMEKQRTGT